MGINLGMMGAIGGAGAALQGEAEVMRKREDADLEEQRQMRLQKFLLQAREEYDIRADERSWKNKVTRAPEENRMAVEKDKALEQGKLDFATTNRDALAQNTQAQNNAKKTPEEREEASAKADQARATAEYYRGAKSEMARAAGEKLDKSGTRLEPDDEMEYKSLGERAKSLQGAIDKSRGEGGWDPAKNPGQDQLQRELAAVQLRQRGILEQYRTGETDPFNVRKPKGGMAGPVADTQTVEGKPGKMKSPRSAEPLPEANIEPGQFDIYKTGTKEVDPAKVTTQRRLIDDIPNPQERANARKALTDQIAPIGPAAGTPARSAAPAGMAGPATVKSEPAPAAAAPAVRTPEESLGQEIDATRAELRDLSADPAKRPGLAAGEKARTEYAAKVNRLRSKLAELEDTYSRMMKSQTGPSFAAAKP